MATVSDLTPGDLVNLAGMTGVFISRGVHPIWPELMLVTWWLPVASEWSLDALDARQEIGDVTPSDERQRQQRLRGALLGKGSGNG
jgi:hypothetical protein